ncbi:gluconokinase [Dyella caseinilytica]|uniref:Gluconokinase n=1 Tax=Dyella caseinilytica TaxID=1849581 RepID=A0ABX7GRR4_9GAMM|nr:gluconokinase [Dyella caseinilytica]QRN53111.1 gluconokinase [Dyella caseinilytica]GGA11559.1 gluconokinase [Dyella caseinilytica]
MPDEMHALVVMGVSGCGKSTVASAICSRTHASLIEGDDFHPAQNVEKMRAGIPLTDNDRQGWLERLVREASHRLVAAERVVLTCSALKRDYRETLRRGIPELGFLFLELSEAEATQRVASRAGHFMPATLVKSQFRDLEPPRHEAQVLTVSATRSLASIVDDVVQWWPLPENR